jgi:NADH-quinone oxidoreductase subunit L
MDYSLYSLVWLVIFLPLAGAIVQAFVGKSLIDSIGPKYGKGLVGFLAVLPIFAAFAIALAITLGLSRQPETNREAVITVFNWIQLQSINIPFELRVDGLSMTMALVVTGIGGLIHVFATGYMAEEKDYSRFFTYLNLFVACMLTLVLGNNLVILFIGWEGVGLCSYLLIGFWYKDLANSKAANKAFIVNRIGDAGLTLGMFFIAFLLAGNKDALGIEGSRFLSYDVILPAAENMFKLYPNETTIICLLLFVGAMGKSAQFPLYIWLPDAMAGPTPVSALIHAATMVTSGVVLLNRMSPLFLLSPLAMTVVAVVGAITALLGASIAFGQTDIKKVLAYSTVSQLGYMFIACGVGAFWAGMFHVITHAFFKALLFLGSGSVIYAMAHSQDMRNYGNLQKHIKITYGLMGVGFLAIAGVPFLFSGFWSKEMILKPAVNDVGVTLALGIPGIPTWGALAGWIGFIVALMTAFYMTRMMVLTFGGGKEQWRSIEPVHAHAGHAHEDHAGHAGHADHGHAAHHHHGDDPHGFFMTDEEAHAGHAHDHDHHHELDKNHNPKEVPVVMWAPLVILALFSTGLFGYWLETNHLLEHWLFPGAGHHGGKEKEVAIGYWVLVGLSAVTSIGGILWGLGVYGKGLPEKEGFDEKKWSPIRLAAGRQWGIDHLLTNVIGLQVGGALGRILKAFDEWVIDGLVRGFGYLSSLVGSLLRQPQTGKVRHYALMMSLGVIFLLGWLVYTLFMGGTN